MLELNNVHLRHFLSNDYVHFFLRYFKQLIIRLYRKPKAITY